MYVNCYIVWGSSFADTLSSSQVNKEQKGLEGSVLTLMRAVQRPRDE